MSSVDCRTVIQNGHNFLLSYARLVALRHSAELCLLKLRPKIHYLNHIFSRVFEEYLEG